MPAFANITKRSFKNANNSAVPVRHLETTTTVEKLDTLKPDITQHKSSSVGKLVEIQNLVHRSARYSRMDAAQRMGKSGTSLSQSPDTNAHAHRTSVIQRYIDNQHYLISDGGQLAVPKNTARPHYYFSSDKAYQASQMKLSSIDSPVKLNKGEIQAEIGLHRITAEGKRDEGKDHDHPLKVHECIEVAAKILKAADSGKWQARVRNSAIDLNPHNISSIQKLIHPIVTSPSSMIRNEAEYDAYIAQAENEITLDTMIPGTDNTFIENLRSLNTQHFPKTLKIAIRDEFVGSETPIHKVMLFLDQLKNKGKNGGFKNANEDSSIDIVKSILDSTTDIYAGAFAYDSRQPQVTSGYQINEHAVAQLGEALALLSTGTREKGTDKWNFHFAAVIATDGRDIITMENETNSMEDQSGFWAFKMYGAGIGQSFHEQHAYGGEKPITVPLSPTTFE